VKDLRVTDLFNSLTWTTRAGASPLWTTSRGSWEILSFNKVLSKDLYNKDNNNFSNKINLQINKHKHSWWSKEGKMMACMRNRLRCYLQITAVSTLSSNKCSQSRSSTNNNQYKIRCSRCKLKIWLLNNTNKIRTNGIRILIESKLEFRWAILCRLTRLEATTNNSSLMTTEGLRLTTWTQQQRLYLDPAHLGKEAICSNKLILTSLCHTTSPNYYTTSRWTQLLRVLKA